MPVLSNEIKNIDYVITEIGGFLASEKIEFLFVGNSGMIFEFYLFSIASVVNFLPNKLLTIFRNIHLIEIVKDAFIDVIASMDEK